MTRVNGDLERVMMMAACDDEIPRPDFGRRDADLIQFSSNSRLSTADRNNACWANTVDNY